MRGSDVYVHASFYFIFFLRLVFTTVPRHRAHYITTLQTRCHTFCCESDINRRNKYNNESNGRKRNTATATEWDTDDMEIVKPCSTRTSLLLAVCSWVNIILMMIFEKESFIWCNTKKMIYYLAVFVGVCECMSLLLPNDDFSSSNSFLVMVAVMVFLYFFLLLSLSSSYFSLERLVIPLLLLFLITFNKTSSMACFAPFISCASTSDVYGYFNWIAKGKAIWCRHCGCYLNRAPKSLSFVWYMYFWISKWCAKRCATIKTVSCVTTSNTFSHLARDSGWLCGADNAETKGNAKRRQWQGIAISLSNEIRM